MLIGRYSQGRLEWNVWCLLLPKLGGGFLLVFLENDLNSKAVVLNPIIFIIIIM